MGEDPIAEDAVDEEPGPLLSFESIDQLRIAFNDGAGHPRIILLVDPI